MISRNAMPCTQPFQVLGSPPLSIGTSTLKRGHDQRHAKQCEQHSGETVHPGLDGS
jgi:hypothetical protein